MFEYLIEDLNNYSFRLHLPKYTAIFMIFINPITWPIITYRFGNWITNNINIPVLKQLLLIIYFFLKKLSVIFTSIEIGRKAIIGKGLYIAHLGNIVIGNKAVIGNYCYINNGVTIGGAGRKEKYGHPSIGNNVYFGAGAKVIGKIHVGNNVSIGANAVVLKSVPDNAVVVGVPAKIISYQGSNDFTVHRLN